ncbi:hydrogenase-2 small subunit [Pectobacterium atrosepticum SCRI1043]|uniref:hydrogenase (acceptor) n=1 Tax=Pectobacterium atrosepticum (strain SCRI 1043 / ATCC BAA-672) TaxID=218491 RepID=Q6D7V0_PECAS|nr:hydrogenase 2 small subunit [Pectobacterium atrosepticum]GKV86403.1 hydrogenase 2 small subunit [Pectobacterium carotovorum subsp. carotovorum]AIA70182.1 hydrogenase 2 small subunit [Pectobacterium atrosepticum]AIK13102.1 hydrogenase-2 small subunit [Pectobacterium atrosepticum]KFX16927.1 hydrogenase 2 small subunit [Pectobacterium atrosepticum]KMK80743.1 hydrogenase 2 small subunit [Pectobacterium atrosepticum ICMP 1526]
MTEENKMFFREGVNRRDFMKLCAALAATMGLSSRAAADIASSVSASARPPVIWIGAQECTGCTESLLRATHPTIESLLLNVISMEYHEVLSAAFGEQAEENKHHAIEKYKGQYVLVVDGSIPIKDGGIYCMVAGKPIVDHIRDAAQHAAAIIAIGSCSAWGGVPASGVNPTGAVSLQEILPDKTVINIPGCPPNPHNFLATVAHIITYQRPPALDAKNRPEFAYARLIHENCERRPHFDAGRFAKQFGDDGHRQGWCLYHLGCKGPETYGNCPTLEFCDVGGGIWPVGIGHPCYGCNEQGIGFTKGIAQLANVENPTPRNAKPDVMSKEGGNVSLSTVGLLGGVVGLVAGVSLMTVKELGRQQKMNRNDGDQPSRKE